MKKLISLTLLFSAFLITSCFSESKIISANSFSEITQLIQQSQDPHHTLLALDDDDTLTMMPCPNSEHCQYLGGPAWFEWQYHLPISSKERIWKNFNDLMAINNLIFSICGMPLTDKEIPNTLKQADKSGMKITVVTARAYTQMSQTERQFSQDGILPEIEKAAIVTPTGHISFPGFYFPRSWQTQPVRRIAYLHGVLYACGQNKGEMIQQFLAKTAQTKNIRHIIFVDDTMQNVVDVANQYKNNPNVDVISVHYTKLVAHKAAFLHGKNAKILQEKANAEWYAVKAALTKDLPGFSLYHQTVSP